MKLEHIPIDESVGTILVHNVAGADGRKALAKGQLVRAEDMDKLRALGKTTVYAARLEAGDVREDEAAEQLARRIAGEDVERSKPSGGRVNFYAAQRGFLSVNAAALAGLNALDGITLATIARYAPVAPKKMIATLKTIGLALPEATLQAAENMVRTKGVILSVATVKNRRVAIILTGSENGRARVQEIYTPPIRARVEELGAEIVSEAYTAEDEDAIAGAIDAAARAGAQLIVLAGETSIMDAGDVTPRGIQRAGGNIVVYGAPVEPGNLMLLAYRDTLPILGAPGCVKSRETNVVDLLLPRLLTGERVTRAEVGALAEGGLLIGD